MKEKLQKYEEERKRILKNCTIQIVVGLLALILGVVITIAIGNPIFMIIGFVILIVFLGITSSVSNKFSKRFKNEIVVEIISEEFDDAKYLPDKGISLEEFMKPQLCKKPDRYYCEDYLSATYKGIPFVMSDVRLQEEQSTVDSKGNRSTTYIDFFKGRMIIFDYQRELDMVVKVVETTSLGCSKNNLVSVETESIQFNKKFKTFASSEHDAFYILTPQFQEKMLELEQKYSGNIFFAFIHGKLYLGINNRGDSFEINIKKPVDEKFLQMIYGQINIAPAIIEEFKLASAKFNENNI